MFVIRNTRFLILGSSAAEPAGHDKTSIVFVFSGDYPGSLDGVIKAFADNNINLPRVESIPAKQSMGKYIFYIDFNGHYWDEKVGETLHKIKRQVYWLKIIGSYPAVTGKKA